MFESIRTKLNIFAPLPVNKPVDKARVCLYPNLQPLKQDTVSFSGKGLPHNKKVTNKAYYGGIGPLARKILNEAQEPMENFEKTLKDIFSSCCEFEGNVPKHKIGHLKFNKKSEKSLREKMASNQVLTEDEAKDTIRDIIRARIVIDDTKGNVGGNIACSKLVKAVGQNKIKIVNIKNYYEMDKNYNQGEDFKYITMSNLLKLDKAITDNCGISALKSGQTRENGYNAVHIIFELEDGFYGELQIMGKNVEKIKEIEDVLYKIHSNKVIDSKFAEVQNAYDECIKDKPKREKELSEYTRRAFNAERLKELDKYSGDETTEFLPLPKNSKLPEIFDFNNLAKIYRG